MPSNPYEIRGSFKGVQTILANFQQIEKTLRDIEKAAKDVKAATGSMGAASTQQAGQNTQAARVQATAMERLAKAGREYRMAMMDGRDIMQEFISPFRELQQSAMRLGVAQAQLKALNMGAEDTQKAFAAIDKTVKDIGGLRTSNVTADLIGIKSAVGDLSTAIEVLPTVAKMRFSFQTLFQADPKRLEADIVATMKALEQMGAITQKPGGGVDLTRFEKSFDAMLRIKSYTQGRVGGEQMRQFVARSSAAGMTIDPEGLMELASLMEAGGGSQTGVALAAAVKSFRAMRQGGGGAMSADTMAKLGMLDMSKVEMSQEGRIKKALPGAMPISDLLLGGRPLQFADAVAEAIQKHGKNVLKRDVKMDSAKDITDILIRMTPNKNAADMLLKMILLRNNIRKDVENMKKAMGSEELFQLAKDSDVGKVITFTEALEDFKERVGLPLLSMLGGLAKAGKPFLDFFASYPNITLWTFALIKAGFAGFKMIAVIQQFRAASAIINGMNTSLAQTGTTATSTWAAMSRGQKFLSVAAWTLGPAAALLSLQAILTIINSLTEQREKLEKWRKKFGAMSGQWDLDRIRGQYADKNVPTDRIRADLTMQSVKEVKYFDKTFNDRFGGTNLGMGRIGDRRSQFNAKQLLQQDFAHLQIPSQYAAFREQLMASTSIPEDRKRVIESALSEAFPKAHAAFMNMAETSQTLNEVLTRLIENDRQAAEAANKLKEQQDKTNSSLDRFQKKLDAFKVPGVTLDEDGNVIEQPPESSNARGGLMRRDHLARVHKGEAVVPGGAGAREFFRQAGIGGGDITLTFHAPIYASPGTNTADIKRAAFEGVMAGKHELERALTTMQNDRRLGGNG